MTTRAYLGTTYKNGSFCVCWSIDQLGSKTANLIVIDKSEMECGLSLAIKILEQLLPNKKIIVYSCNQKILTVAKPECMTVQYCQHELIKTSFKLSYENVFSLKKDTLMSIPL